MDSTLPSNTTLEAFSSAVPWQQIESQKRRFNDVVQDIARRDEDGQLSLDELSDRVDATIIPYFDADPASGANIFLSQMDGHTFILGSAVSQRYRSGKTLAQAITPYNLNPSVNHTNIHETEAPRTRMRAIGAEVELGLLRPDGSMPAEADMQTFIGLYQDNARRLGITPQIDREACQFQVEAHVAPGIGYTQTRRALDGILQSLVRASEYTNLHTAIMSAYPIETDFDLTPDPKVETAVDLMVSVNNKFPDYATRLQGAKDRYSLKAMSNVVQVFRIQGCHIHLDLAGRSEAFGLLAFYTMLRSATAIANGALLKGGPFVNGTCDEDLLCVREYLRSTTVTGRYLDVPVTPHLSEHGMGAYSELLRSEKANAVARGLLCDDSLGQRVSVMHNPIGRVRPDLGGTKRICTLESTGMAVNVSASRQAAVLTDFEFTHALLENYFRKHGCDLVPMMEDTVLWQIVGPLGTAEYMRQQDQSDRHCTDITLRTATGSEMSLVEFYEMKRRYMHKHLIDCTEILPRDIDDVYMSFERMLDPPSGQSAETVEQYIADPKLRSTGNWGQILKNAFIDEGGTPGKQDSDAVLRVVNRIHGSLRERYR